MAYRNNRRRIGGVINGNGYQPAISAIWRNGNNINGLNNRRR
jgi:hypothetical protein